MTVASFQRLQNSILLRICILPGAEADGGDFGTGVELECSGDGHGSELMGADLAGELRQSGVCSSVGRPEHEREQWSDEFAGG